MTTASVTLWRQVQPLLEAGGGQPLPLYELAAATRIDARALLALFVEASRLGLVTRVTQNRFVLPEMVRKLADLAQDLARTHPDGCFEVREFRDRSGLSRRPGVELLE